MQTITDEYGVEQPVLLLLRRIDELLPSDLARVLREEYEDARRRYQRAARAREAREWVRHIERRPDYPDRLPRSVQRTLDRYRELLERQQEYIEGTWQRHPGRQPRGGVGDD